MLLLKRKWPAPIVLMCLNLACCFGEVDAIAYASVQLTREHPLLSQARSTYELGDFQKTIHLCSAVIRKIDEGKDPENLVLAYALLGGSYVKTAEFEKAASVLEKALKTATAKLPAGHELLDDVHFNLGLYYDRIGAGQQSLNHLQNTLDIRLREFGDNHAAVAEVYSALGELYLYTLLEFRPASIWFEKAIKILENNGSGNALRLYSPYFCMAEVSRRLGDLDKALTYAFKTLSVVESRSEYRRYLERCYTLIGDIYYSQADFNNAIRNYEAGISESIKVDGPAGYYLIRKYTNLGVAYGESGETAQAISCFKRSLEISEKHHLPNSELKAENYLHLGRQLQRKGVADTAAYYLEKYLNSQLDDYGPNHPKTSEALRYVARYFQAEKKYDSALAYIQRSIYSAVRGFAGATDVNPPFEMIKDQPALFEVFRDKGSILLDKFSNGSPDIDNLLTSLECFSISDNLMQISRNSYQHEGSKLFFDDHYHDIYENALKVCYLLYEETGDNTYVETAFMFMEKSKALLLAEALNKAEVFSRAGLPDSLRDMERSLNSALATYRSQLEGDSHHSGQTLQDIQSKIFDISQKQERLLDTISRLYPNYFGVKYQNISTLREVQSYAKENNAALLEYFWGNDRIFMIGLTKDKILFRQRTDPAATERKVLQYVASLQQPSWKENDHSFEGFVVNAHGIYAELLVPLNDVLSEKLIIVRDGPLQLIPFESLLVSNTNQETGSFAKLDYAIRHHTIGYAHSADILLKGIARSAPGSDEKRILAFSYSPADSIRMPPSHGGMDDLPGAALEITAISEILPGTFLLGDDATEEKFKSMAGNFDIIHLAVHGKGDPEKQFSGSLFFRQSPTKAEDGELHVYELYDLALKARLTVLSACESGVGKIFRGEGVFSIARGFAYAGCPSTVMTLWPVSDAASAAIMGDFYQSLNKGKPIDVALRTAKINYLDHSAPQLAHPAYWAAYIPTGNMAPVVKPGLTLMSWLIGIAATVAILSAYYLLKNLRRGSIRRKQSGAAGG